MKTTIVIVRLLLGLIFLVFGLNGFLHFIPQLSAVRNGRAVYWSALCLPLSGPDISAPDHFGGPAPGQSLRPTCADAARSDHRQHSAHSHIDASERSAFGSRRDGAVDRCVPERPLRFHRPLATARPGSGAAATKSRSRKPSRRNLCLGSRSLSEARVRIEMARR